MKAVHILMRINRGNDFIRGNMLRQRKLNQNTMNGFIPVQIMDQFQQICFGRVRGEPVFPGKESHFFTGLGFSPHIDLRGRIFADKNHRKAWHQTGFFL